MIEHLADQAAALLKRHARHPSELLAAEVGDAAAALIHALHRLAADPWALTSQAAERATLHESAALVARLRPFLDREWQPHPADIAASARTLARLAPPCIAGRLARLADEVASGSESRARRHLASEHLYDLAFAAGLVPHVCG